METLWTISRAAGTSRWTLATLLLLVACGSAPGGGFVALQSGGAIGSTCTPPGHGHGCLVGGNARVSCDAATSTWVLVQTCAEGTSCVETVDAATLLKATKCASVDIAGDASGDADATSSDGAPDDAVTTDVAVVSDTGPTECGCMAKGMVFRFDNLTIDSIDKGKHNLQIALNPLWKKDIAGYELNIYAELLEVSATAVKVKLVNGARVANTENDVCLLPYTAVEVVHPRKGCVLEPSAKAAMNVYAGTPAHPKNCAPTIDVKHSIPVRGAVLQAVLNTDCSRIDDGYVSEGHLPEPALGLTCTCLTTGKQGAEECGVPVASFKNDNGCDGCNSKFQNLKTLLTSFGELKYLCSEGNDKAACLTASFSGGRVAKLPGNCGGS